MTTENESGIGLIHATTGQVLMLSKKERILVKEILGKTLSSEGAKEAIKRKFGEEYIEIAHRLLETLSGSEL